MGTWHTISKSLDDALTEILRIAQSAIDREREEAGEGAGEETEATGPGAEADEADLTAGPEPESEPACTIKTLPDRLVEPAGLYSVTVNPANAPIVDLPEDVLPPQRLTVLRTKYWGPRPRRFTVSFLEATPADLRRRIVSHMNAWSRTANKTFVQTRGTGEVRISRGAGGYYSYLGTDISFVPRNRQTMNLEGFTMNTPEATFRRVVRHECGHTLGFPHEHLRRALVRRIDPAKAYRYFRETYGWSEDMVNRNVLTPLEESSILGTARSDEDSIMCYQLPGSITRDGRPIRGGDDINRLDYAFAGRIYPKVFATTDGTADTSAVEDWDPSEDVDLAELLELPASA